MEKISQWFDQLVENYAMATFFQKWVWIDWLALTFVIVGILYGLKKGFVREIVEFLEMLLIVYLVFEHYEKVATVIRVYFTKIPYDSASAIAFFLSGIVIWFVVFIVDANLKKTIHTQTVAAIRYLGGAVIGFFHFLLIFSFMSQILFLTPVWMVKKVFEPGNSYSGPKLIKIARRAHEFASLPVEYFRASRRSSSPDENVSESERGG